MYIVLLFYKYIDIKNPIIELNTQKEICEKNNLVGRILISDEGLNGTLCGTIDQCKAYEEYIIEHQLFFDMNIKKSTSEFICFPKLMVKYKNEIVVLREDKEEISFKDSAEYIEPEVFHHDMENKKEYVIFDARNAYESRIGRFDTAICPTIETSRDFKSYFQNNKKLFDGKDVVMYCTGGVRCERISVLCKKYTTAKRVRHIRNGIHAYTEKYPNGFFRGRNYVFDDRISIKINDSVLTSCDICSKECDLYNNCLNATCNKQYISCDNCLEKTHQCCTHECFINVQNGTVKKRPLLKSRFLVTK